MTEALEVNEKLALHGGTPIRSTRLPYGRQAIDEADIRAVVDVLRSDFLTTGPAVDAFERRIADYVGAKYAVAFANGTAALHGAVFAAGIGPGDEVITTPMTFAASANCVLYMGGTPVFADIQPDTYNIDPDAVKACITPRTKAILPVHYTGQPADMDEILSIAKRHGLMVIEDAAHALGATYKGRRIGTLGDMTVFSLHPVKPVTTGEGGVVTTNDDRLYQRLRLFRTHGITRDPSFLEDDQGPWYYEMQYLGFNYRLTDIQAALGTSQMDKLDVFIRRRAEIAKKYTEAFASMPELETPYQREDRTSGWHLYVIRLNLSALRVGRRQVYEALLAENIGVNVHYIPVYHHPYYRRMGYSRGLCPRAEELYERILTLPLFPGMTDDDVCDVIRAVKKVLGYYRV
ncbi:UDP-4-amino-4,6-dideoxy-N-acetyl-beta-L-altrosamine transaminase [Alicyclobacillus macrosporangiidus]|uniref:UDP-4-amino-4, 6-dideoxy-N-acetyl-beta-L-altrosamine transaminase n=1 Tax=Alicyclobacillus macrosporangiidus TaxID=392015 RepID=UPI000496C210|nr:UDP-4-amino-4,6-dideoxy-N-acetyl-beta-L-altrosamine transaminase [Alicyclobacillus macrosporangiidus]